MSDSEAEFNLSEFNASMAEYMRWAQLSVQIQEIAEDSRELIQDLSTYDPGSTVPLLASLLTLPDYQSHCIRFEILVILAVIYCHGRKKANIRQATHWFYLIGQSRCVVSEDPAEVVFVSLVWDGHKDYRLLNGVWEGAGFYTQRVLDVVATMPDEGPLGQLKKSVRALLILSDVLCERSGLQRYQLGSGKQHLTLPSSELPGEEALISRVTISFDELSEHGIQHSDIEPFLLHPKIKEDMPMQAIRDSCLESYPLTLQADKHLVVVLPSALSITIRDYVISKVTTCDLTEVFDGNLAAGYTKLFREAPLLGGLLNAPVRWAKADHNRWSTFSSEIDEGYYISFHFFLPSVQAHVDGGFKTGYQVEDALVESLKRSIDHSTSNLSRKSNFKRGLIILVGCGWGKGCVMQETEFKFNRSQWHFQSMSAVDLVRLSWLEDMNPHYFWRIQDGLETVEKAGVEIVNLNGILNLIGWVHDNDGNFAPHNQLPEGQISVEQPLTLALPLSSLREVRANSDQSHDRHHLADNTRSWHDVSRAAPNPLFGTESSFRVFRSISDLHKGTLTSVYEGASHLWISISTPNIVQEGIEHQFWDMADEWLHRIGAALDTYNEIASETISLKVYIEFRDAGPPKHLIKRPKPEDLIPLCRIERHDESNACKVVFEAGFMEGFNIPENIAERLFVQNISRAFLSLFGEEGSDDKVRMIETLVVQNDEARSVHFFYAQGFIDYVQDTLPKKFIAIDSIDYAAIKIGLGWRADEENQNNKIEGRKECTKFLGKVVEVLLDELIDSLSAFDRLSTLKRLVANCEKASIEDKRWTRTSAAVLGLHGRDPQTISHIVEQTSKIVGANAASRILIEIALCTCPSDGGAKLSSIEMSKLIARAAFVANIGGLSDAIYYNALAPEITISPLGDILFLNEFGESVVEPMLFRMTEDRFVDNAPLQKRNYENSEAVTDLQEIVSDEFLDIWEIEMGFSLYQARDIMSAIENKGREEHSAILELTRSEYFSLVCSDSVSRDAAKGFLAQFSLVARPEWKIPPLGFENKDIYPWRFARRLSFITRPILQADSSDDPLLVIAPSALHQGVLYVLSGAYYGRFKQSFFRTEKMKNIWKSKVREGHKFNAEIAQRLLDAGWRVRQNVKPSGILNCRMEHDFGDIDVLAWKLDHKQVLVIECKDLSPTRNYSEIAAQLSDYQGIEVGGKADKLKKHLNRILLLQENQEQLQHFTKIQDPQVVSCLVCSGVVPMQYVKIDALADTHVGTLEEVLAKLAT